LEDALISSNGNSIAALISSNGNSIAAALLCRVRIATANRRLQEKDIIQNQQSTEATAFKKLLAIINWQQQQWRKGNGVGVE